MRFSSFHTSFICLSALFISFSLPATGCAGAGNNSLTEPRTTVSVIRQPEGYSSDGQHLVTRLTDPVTDVYPSLLTTKGRPTEPETTVSIIRQPEGYSSDGQHLVTRLTDPVTDVYPSLLTTKGRPTEPLTTTSRTW